MPYASPPIPRKKMDVASHPSHLGRWRWHPHRSLGKLWGNALLSKGGGGISSIPLKKVKMASPLLFTKRWLHPLLSQEDGGGIPMFHQNVVVASLSRFRRWMWHPHFSSDFIRMWWSHPRLAYGGGCGIPTSLKKMEVAYPLLLRRWL